MSLEQNATATVTALPLTIEAYKPYGNVIEAAETFPWKSANMGTSRRFNHLAEVVNLRDDKAKLNLCLFNCSPLKHLPLEMRLLEKHPLSTQVFIPMNATGRFLVIVCQGDEQPDLATLAAFVATGPKGITYYPGIWHYPMTVLDRNMDFTCLVYENGSPEDCVITNLPKPILVNV